MKRYGTLIVVSLVLLYGCGAEPLGAAATGAQIKKREIEQGQRTMEQAKNRIGEAMQVQQQRADQAGERN